MELWTSTPLPPPMIEDGEGNDDESETTDLAIPGPGCDIDGDTYMDGMQVIASTVARMSKKFKALSLSDSPQSGSAM